MNRILCCAVTLLAACCQTTAAERAPVPIAYDGPSDRRPAGRAERLRELGAEVAEAERLAAGNDPGAESRFRAAVRTAEGLGKSIWLARALDGLAAVARGAGRLEEAETLYLRAIPLWEEFLGREQPRVAVSLHNLAAVQLERGHPGPAAERFRQALAIWVTTRGADSPEADNTRRALRVATDGTGGPPG